MKSQKHRTKKISWYGVFPILKITQIAEQVESA